MASPNTPNMQDLEATVRLARKIRNAAAKHPVGVARQAIVAVLADYVESPVDPDECWTDKSQPEKAPAE